MTDIQVIPPSETLGQTLLALTRTLEALVLVLEQLSKPGLVFVPKDRP